ncbi:MAG: DUF4422 domain-containing protein [Lachnospiraceae bacterium]|nr:DUF4422 domain-containing protein [Lachnospiraceae bacterium]
MFVMKWEWFDAYCTWLFPIILECDRRIDVTGYTYAEAREAAYLSEFMLDIWMEKNKIPYKEMNVIFMERQNWLKGAGHLWQERWPGQYIPAFQV